MTIQKSNSFTVLHLWLGSWWGKLKAGGPWCATILTCLQFFIVTGMQISVSFLNSFSQYTGSAKRLNTQEDINKSPIMEERKDVLGNINSTSAQSGMGNVKLSPRMGWRKVAGRMSLPEAVLHVCEINRKLKNSRTPSPIFISSSDHKKRHSSDNTMENKNHLSPHRPRTKSMPTSRSRSMRSRRTSSNSPSRTIQSSDSEHPSVSPVEEIELGPFYRVRSFSTCGKNVINRGDSFKSCTTSVATSLGGSCISIQGESSVFVSSVSRSSSVQSLSSNGGIPPEYKVLILGSHSVGRRSLIQQFTTSEYMGNDGLGDGK